MTRTPAPKVAVVMGSRSDHHVMVGAAEVLADLGVTHEVRVLSAHRTPHDMIAFGTEAAERGIQVIIAGAGGAAHLPGMLASVTTLPVIGVPIALRHLDGVDALLSIAQMPTGVPVATVAIDGARNAGHLAARIVGLDDRAVSVAVAGHQRAMANESRQSTRELGIGMPFRAPSLPTPTMRA